MNPRRTRARCTDERLVRIPCARNSAAIPMAVQIRSIGQDGAYLRRDGAADRRHVATTTRFWGDATCLTIPTQDSVCRRAPDHEKIRDLLVRQPLVIKRMVDLLPQGDGCRHLIGRSQLADHVNRVRFNRPFPLLCWSRPSATPVMLGTRSVDGCTPQSGTSARRSLC